MAKTTQVPTEGMIDVRPDTVTITERSHIAYPAAVALIRQGWNINTDYPPISFESTGFATIILVRAKPDTTFNALAVEIADRAEAVAAEQHIIAYERDVQAKATYIVEQAKKAEKAALLAAEIEAQRQALQALELAAKAV